MDILNFKNYIVNKLDGLKGKGSVTTPQRIEIKNEEKLIAFLEPVTFQYKTLHPEYTKLFSTWRIENPEGFANIFDVTETRTKFWLDNILLKREDRILFVIFSEDNKPLGHLGLSSFDFTKKTCEIDNVVRGVKNEVKGVMTHATKAIIEWAFHDLNVSEIYLRVLSDNLHALNFYSLNGFQKQYDIPLYKYVLENEIKWVDEKKSENDVTDRYFTYMKYKK